MIKILHLLPTLFLISLFGCNRPFATHQRDAEKENSSKQLHEKGEKLVYQSDPDLEKRQEGYYYSFAMGEFEKCYEYLSPEMRSIYSYESYKTSLGSHYELNNPEFTEVVRVYEIGGMTSYPDIKLCLFEIRYANATSKSLSRFEFDIWKKENGEWFCFSSKISKLKYQVEVPKIDTYKLFRDDQKRKNMIGIDDKDKE